MDFWIQKFSSRKFWTFIIAVVAAIAGLATGDLTVPQFVAAIALASGTYQVGEGIADRGNRQ